MPYTTIAGIPVWGDHDEATLAQIQRCAYDDRNRHNQPLDRVDAHEPAW